MSTIARAPANQSAVHLRWDPDLIPPFPAVALKALQLVAGTDTSLINLCNLIRTDAAFSTAILKIANSPLIAFPKQITSMVQASILLGFQRLRSVVVTVGLRSYVQSSFTPLMHSCWRHSLACALIAERAAPGLYLDKEFVFTASVLHDVGRIAMAAFMPSQYLLVTQSAAEDCDDVLRIERQFCGIDHCAAGACLVEAWRLPEVLLEIVSRHHEPAPGGMAAILAPGCALADCLGFTVVPCRCQRNYSDIVAELPEPARDCFPTDPKILGKEIVEKIRLIETS